MDSFYDAPRQPPIPPRIPNLQKEPAVPEVSIIQDTFRPLPRCFNSDMRPPLCHYLPGANSDTDSFLSMSKKQVRFQSPPQPQGVPKENRPPFQRLLPDLNGKDFKQIYMSNVPDRHLDLSVFEQPAVCRKPFVPPKCTNAVPLQSIENNVQTLTSNRILPKCTEIEKQNYILPRCTEVAKQDDEPTIRDLFKIIQQQNEQIMQLQRQVNNLKESIRQPQIEATPNTHTNSPTKKGIISIIDVKTANFEVLYHNPHTKTRKPEAVIHEIPYNSTEFEDQNRILRLDDSVEVEQNPVSMVEPNIQISMEGLDEYHSSEEEEEQNVGTSLYNGLLNQINNALKITSECPKPEVTGQTIKAVKQATLQHLKTMGVNLSPIQESNEITGGSETDDQHYDQKDVSLTVKQLLMKYLPDDKLIQGLPQQNVPKKTSPHNPELSFATLQYLKKYNIIGNNNIQRPEAQKFLDVTALKLQSKLK